MDLAESLIGPRSGAPIVRKVIQIYESMKTFSETLNGFDADGILLADECMFIPNQKVKCSGGLSDFVFDDGSRRLLDMAQEMEETFVTYDAAGYPISPAHRFLTGECTAKFEKPECTGGCTGCQGKVAKAKCKGRQIACKGASVEGLSIPFLSDPMSVLGLASGKDIQIIDFTPPPLEFTFEKEIRSVLYSAPTVEMVIGFGITVTVEYGIVLDSSGIRQAVEEKNPLKALNSFALKDTFDGVDKPLIVFDGTVSVAVECSAVFLKIGVSGSLNIRVEIDVSHSVACLFVLSYLLAAVP